MFNPRPKLGDKSFTFPFQCKMLKMFAAWPPEHENDSKFVKIYKRWATVLILCVAFICYTQVTFLINSWGNILMFTECGCTLVMGLHCLLRLMHLKYRRNSMRMLMRQFVDDIWISSDLDYPISMSCEKELIPIRLMSILLLTLILMYITVPLYELVSIEEDAQKPFPYRMIFPYDANQGFAYFLSYLMSAWAGFVCVVTLFAEDSLICYFIIYTCGRFGIIHKEIENVISTVRNAIASRCNGKQLSYDEFRTITWNEFNRAISSLIKHQNTVIRFCSDLEFFFSPILFVNFLASTFLICLTGFQIAAVNLTKADLVKLIIYVISALNQLFVLCWNGEKLIENSTKTAHKLYECGWEMLTVPSNRNDNANQRVIGKMDPKDSKNFIRSLVIAMCRFQKPVKITALKFSVLSLESFTKILSKSLSYFTLLQTLVEKAE